METNSQLIKKIKEGGYNNVYPIAYIDGIIDKESNEKLSDILIRYNNIMVPWQGDVASTRNRVPSLMRRQGIVITYITDLSEIVTEVYKGTVEDIKNNWADNINWELVPDLKFVQDNASKLPDGTITLEKLSPALQELISQSGSVVNMPDDEDLEQKDMVLKFKDRPYNSELASGKGYKILRKNWTNIGTKTINLLTQDVFNQSNTIYEIRYDFDLNGGEINIPEGCVLEFQGGSLINGSIVGKNTGISTESGRIFRGIVIEGTWCISSVYSNWFDFVEGGYDNIQNFRNLMTLAKSDIYTHVYIQEGEFYTSTWTNNENGEYESTVGISVPSNTYIHNSATIKEVANPYEKTSMFYLNNVENVTIEGGKLIGDISNHTGTTGEWGMGIYPHAVKNLVIKNIEISEFWGDGIDIQSPYSDYINQTATGHCKNVLIDNVRCLNNRRQGISIEAVDGLVIRDSEFSGTGSIKSTAPGAGIDIEPWNEWQVCRNITIENCEIQNNVNGLLIHLPSAFNQEHNIRVINCKSDGGISTKNVNGLIIDGYLSSDKDGFLVLFNKQRNVEIVNSSFGNEIYFNGDLENITISRCLFDMASNSWNDIGLYAENGDTNAYRNINFKDCELKFNNKLRAVQIGTSSAEINFINCNIESNSTYDYDLGYGDFVGNTLFLQKIRSLKFINKKNSTVNINNNRFYIYTYNDSLLTFSDENSIASGSVSYDYDIVNNQFITYGFWEPFGGNGKTIVKNRMINNIFDVDVSQFVPSTWLYSSPSNITEYNYKECTNVARVNVATNKCVCIKVPYKRSTLKISLINKAVIYAHLLSSETTVNINPDITEGNVTHYTYFKHPVNLNAEYVMAMPVFAYNIIEDTVYIYINNNTGGAKLFTIHSELLVQKEYRGNPITYTNVDKPSLDFSINVISPCYTDSLSLRPFIGKYKGFQVTYKSSIITYNGEKWIDSNGNDAGIKTSGTFANKPISPSIGFAYLCTDKQTTEGATNGIMIYHKGNNVWVDALGRVV